MSLDLRFNYYPTLMPYATLAFNRAYVYCFPLIDSFTYHYKCRPDQSTHLYLPFEIEYILHFQFYDATFWMIFLLSILAI